MAGRPSWSKLVWAAACVVIAACAARPPTTTPSDRTALKEVVGTVVAVGSFGFGLVPDEDPGTRYAPDHLPPELAVDGLRVVFSGQPREPDADVRRWGTPIRLTAIRRLDADD